MTDELRPIGQKFSDLTSRYHGHDFLRLEDGTEVFSTYEFPDIPFTENDIYHEVQPGEEGRLDLISWNYYNTPRFDWVIMLANDFLSDPVKDIVAGITLRIPSLEWVSANLIKG